MIMGGFWSFSFQLLNPKPARSHSYNWTKISSLEVAIFELKMMVKSGLEFFYFEIQRAPPECCCPVQKNLPRKAELTWQASRYLSRGSLIFKIKNSRPLFTIIFKSKIPTSRLEILVLLFNQFLLVRFAFLGPSINYVVVPKLAIFDPMHPCCLFY